MPPLGVFPLVFMTPQSHRDPPWGPMAVLTMMTVGSSLSMVSLFEAEIHVTGNCFWDKEGFRIPFQEPPDSSLAPHTPGTVRVLNKDRRTKEVPGIPPQPHISLQPAFSRHCVACFLPRGLPSLSFILQDSCLSALPEGGCLHPSRMSSPSAGISDSQDWKLRVSQHATIIWHRL